MKKFLALLLAAMMLLATASFAFADGETGDTSTDGNQTEQQPSEGDGNEETTTVVVDSLTNETTGHKYSVYQIFAATQATDDATAGNGVIGVTGWGNGVNPDNFLAALKADDTYKELFKDCTTAMDVASVMSSSPNNTNTALAEQFAELANMHKATPTMTDVGEETGVLSLAKGYYLFVDTTNTNTSASQNPATATGTYKNLALLQVVSNGDIKISQKNDVPKVEKKVEEDQDGISWNDVADYDIGDAVPFKLTATLPSAAKYALYDTYMLKFWDEMDNGLTFNAESVVVKINGTEIPENIKTGEGENVTVTHTNYSVVADDDLHGFTVTITDLKSLKDSEGSALTVNATDKIVVEYTATLNKDCNIGLVGNENKVYLEYSNNPNYDGTGETGKTPEDQVVVFTFELRGTKVDAGNTATTLAGAQFEVYNGDPDAATTKWITSIDTTTKAIVWSNNANDEKLKFTSDSNGLITITGLDDGTYYLKEVVAPAGYALPSDPEVIVTLTGIKNSVDTWDGVQKVFTNEKAESDTLANPSNTLSVTSTVGSKETTGNVVTGTANDPANVTITNTKGGTLPETGGIGTTLFYLFGSMMAAGSALILVVRRRAEAEEE